MKNVFAIFLTMFALASVAGLPALASDPSPVPTVAAAVADFPVPAADIAPLLLQLATNYKTLGVMGILILLTLLSVQAIKQFAPESWKYKRLATLGVSLIWSILSGIAVPGSNWLSIVVTVFITSGGAMALYEALKGAGVIGKAAA